jgi:hypothetical protein
MACPPAAKGGGYRGQSKARTRCAFAGVVADLPPRSRLAPRRIGLLSPVERIEIRANENNTEFFLTTAAPKNSRRAKKNSR